MSAACSTELMITHLSALHFFIVFNVVKNTVAKQLLRKMGSKQNYIILNWSSFESHLSEILPFSCHTSHFSPKLKCLLFWKHLHMLSTAVKCTSSTWEKKLFASHITYIMWHFQVKQHIQCEKCRAGLDFYPTGFDWKVKSGRYKNGLLMTTSKKKSHF